MIVFVEVARLEEVGLSEAGPSDKVSLLEKVMIILPAVEQVLSSRVLTVKAGSRSYYRGVCYCGVGHQGRCY